MGVGRSLRFTFWSSFLKNPSIVPFFLYPFPSECGGAMCLFSWVGTQRVGKGMDGCMLRVGW